MENVKHNEIDLRLALAITNKQDEPLSNSGAGANANSWSTTDTNLRHRPLPELVWSTRNGLGIKCGGCSSCFAGMNPCMSSDIGALPSQHDEKFEKDGEVKCVHFIETKTQNKGKGKECMSVSIGNVTGASEGNIGLTRDIKASAKCGPPFIEKVEETAENDVMVKEAENVGEESSGESLESCNGASKKNRRKGFEHQFIITSKRLKKQSQECGVVKKQDSSFMNWISNMVKPCQQEEGHHPVDDKTLDNVVNNIFGFRSVFQSLYSQRVEKIKTQRENSKEIIVFDSQKSYDEDNLNRKAFPKPQSTLLATINNSDLRPTASAGCKRPVAVTSSYEIDALKRTTPMATRTCFFCGKTGHESHDCLQIHENRNVFLKKKVNVSNSDQIASTSENNKLLNQDKILRIPKEMFHTIRRLRLSRTDILKWMNSRSAVPSLDGYFLRLRLAKWEEGVGGAGYYVACITDENPSKGSRQPIRVNIGGVQCLVECRYISNCDFLEDELITWWRTTLKSGRALMEEDLTSKLEEKKKLLTFT